jgi:FkbM family methyltransferase
MHVMNRYLSAHHTCFDIGANLGIHTLVMSKLVPQGRVIAFEASRRNFEFLRLNIADNEIRNVAPYHCALWDSEGLLNLTFIEELAGCSFVCPRDSPGSGLEKVRSVVTAEWAQTEAVQVSEEVVESIRLDTWVAQHDVKRLDLIKMDAEGAEAVILRGAIETISRFRPLLITEYNPACAVEYFGEREDAYFEVLSGLYPFRYLIHEGGKLSRVDHYEALREVIQSGKGWEDLLCSFTELN